MIPGFDTRWLLEGKNECPGDVAFAGRRFLVYGHLVRASERGGGFLATTYWVDVTELSAVRDRYQASRPVAAVLLLDNYEDLMKTSRRTSAPPSTLKSTPAWTPGWTGPAGCCGGWSGTGISSFLRSSISPGSWIKNLTFWTPSTRWSIPAACPPPLSIGVGKDGSTFQELMQFANLSIEMALSRGGDQAVIRNKFTFEFLEAVPRRQRSAPR